MGSEPDPLAVRLAELDSAAIQTILDELRRRFGATEEAFVHTCVRCGLCADSCHYYLTSQDPKDLPAHKLNLVLSVFKHHFTFGGRAFPGWMGAKALDSAGVAEWVDSLFGRCSGCGRCTIACTSGIDIRRIIRAARGALAAADLVPPDLQSTVMTAVRTGNNMAIPTEEWLETAAWIEEELQGETGDPDARIPVDREGADFLYAINPREVKFFPLSILAAAKVLRAMGASWTFSSVAYDVTNYGLYSGDDAHAGLMSRRLVEAAEQLGAKTLLLGECGHGFAANRWEAPEWLDRRYSVRVRSILEVVAEALRAGTIRLDAVLFREEALQRADGDRCVNGAAAARILAGRRAHSAAHRRERVGRARHQERFLVAPLCDELHVAAGVRGHRAAALALDLVLPVKQIRESSCNSLRHALTFDASSVAFSIYTQNCR